MIVADASLLANLLIPGLDWASAVPVLERDPDWRAPRLWQYEFKNTLTKYVRHGGLPKETAQRLLQEAMVVMKSGEQAAPAADALAIAIEYETSAYDAEYVALAQVLGAPLVTYDQKLAKAVSGLVVSPAGFISSR